jgi:hypothetical protein
MNPCTALVVWADEAEQERLRAYPRRAMGDEFRHRLTDAPLANNPDADIIRANRERRAQWQARRTRKLNVGVVWLGHRTHVLLVRSKSTPHQRL